MASALASSSQAQLCRNTAWANLGGRRSISALRSPLSCVRHPGAFQKSRQRVVTIRCSSVTLNNEASVATEGNAGRRPLGLGGYLQAVTKKCQQALSMNEWMLAGYRDLVDQVNAWEPHLQSLSDSQLAGKTTEFKERLAQGEDLDSLQAEAFAVVREAAKRTLGIRHFDVQIMGGAVLHAGAIAEMKTGEGKTLVATSAAYLNALQGRGVHVITVNDYLARRDAEWMGRIHRFLGLSVGVIQNDMKNPERADAYARDITYATSSEVGFDYLRDNLISHKEERVLRWPDPLCYAIVDEIDSVLIDEGRTPLLISNLSSLFLSRFPTAATMAKRMKRDKHYLADFKRKSVQLTDAGVDFAEAFLSVDENGTVLPKGSVDIFGSTNSFGQFLLTALRAKEFYVRDRDYLVKDGEVQIIDPSTGRVAGLKRWEGGLHQAVEAKEGLNVKPLAVNSATISYQSLMKLYHKVGGMTGTAKSEEAEFVRTYGLPVVVIPPNRPNRRVDHPPVVCITSVDKMERVKDEIWDMVHLGRPVLVGTHSVAESEKLSEFLSTNSPGLRDSIEHQVLNARPEYVAREAEIVAQAGRRFAVTISTNMAGRGTDIILGGNHELLARDMLRWLLLHLRTPESALEDPHFHPVHYSGPHNAYGNTQWMPPEIKLGKDTKDLMKPVYLRWRALTKRLDQKRKEEFLEQVLVECEALLGSGVAGRYDIGSDFTNGAATSNGASHSSSSKGEEGVEEEARSRAEMESGVVEAEFPGMTEFPESETREGESEWGMRQVVEKIEELNQLFLRDCKEHCVVEGKMIRDAGGLHVIGTALRESKRIDNQLKGRAGRQGDPGSSRFIVSLEDTMIMEDAPDATVSSLFKTVSSTYANLDPSESGRKGFTFPLLTSVLYETQSHMEKVSFQTRKQMNDFGKALEVQRRNLYGLRQQVLEDDLQDAYIRVNRYFQKAVDDLVLPLCPPEKPVELWDLSASLGSLSTILGTSGPEDLTVRDVQRVLIEVPQMRDKIRRLGGKKSKEESLRQAIFLLSAELLQKVREADGSDDEEEGEEEGEEGEGLLSEGVEVAAVRARWEIISDGSRPGESAEMIMALRKILGDLVAYRFMRHLGDVAGKPGEAEEFIRTVQLYVLDQSWRAHLQVLARLRNSVVVQSFGSVNPQEEYMIESTRLFLAMLSSMTKETVFKLLTSSTAAIGLEESVVFADEFDE